MTKPLCKICSRPIPAGPCGNPVCGWPNRAVDRVFAICKRTGAIEAVLKRFKYNPGEAGWAPILGRIIIGWLDINERRASRYDVMIVNPTHPSRQPIRHTEAILAAARSEDQLAWWPLEDENDTTLVKHTETTSATTRGTRWGDKHDAAQELRSAVRVAHPERVKDQAVLVIDDVTTTLLQLNVLAGLLKRAGAARVDGLVIARQQY